jgi:hypothetical protein
VLWVVESIEPERTKTFELKVIASDPARIRNDVEAILRRSDIGHELRSAGPKELVYETQLPLTARTDRISNAILLLEPNGEMEVVWEDRQKKK